MCHFVFVCKKDGVLQHNGKKVSKIHKVLIFLTKVGLAQDMPHFVKHSPETTKSASMRLYIKWSSTCQCRIIFHHWTSALKSHWGFSLLRILMYNLTQWHIWCSVYAQVYIYIYIIYLWFSCPVPCKLIFSWWLLHAQIHGMVFSSCDQWLEPEHHLNIIHSLQAQQALIYMAVCDICTSHRKAKAHSASNSKTRVCANHKLFTRSQWI